MEQQGDDPIIQINSFIRPFVHLPQLHQLPIDLPYNPALPAKHNNNILLDKLYRINPLQLLPLVNRYLLLPHSTKHKKYTNLN